MPDISNLNFSPESDETVSAVLLPEGFLNRYNLVLDNLDVDSVLVQKLQYYLREQLYEEACVLLKMEGRMAVTWENDVLERISNVAWRRLQMLPEATQQRVEAALRSGDVDFAAQVLKSF